MNNLGIAFREMLTGSLQPIQDILDQMIAAIQGTWNIEHDANTGMHGAITANSLTLNTKADQTGNIAGDLQVNGQLRFLRGPWLFDPQGNAINIANVGPPQITANTHNYNPAGFDQAIILALTTDASRNLTGLNANRQQRRLLLLLNRGSFDIVLKHNDANSSAVNRFACPNAVDLTLNSNDSAWVYYDAGTAIWRVVGT